MPVYISTLVRIVLTLLLLSLSAYAYVVIRMRWYPIAIDRWLYAKNAKRGAWGIAFYSIIISVICIIIICLLAFIWQVGSGDAYADVSSSKNIIWAIICQFVDPGNVAMASCHKGDVIALLSALAGVICLSGLCVSSVVSFVNKRSEQYAQGMRHYTYGLGKYVVIIGVNEQAATIIRKALARTDRVDYVLVQTSQDVPLTRNRLNLALTHEEEKHVVFYSGDRTSSEDIEYLQLEKADELYILGEDMYIETEQDHDAYNMNCQRHVSDYMRDHKVDRKLRCHVNFEYQSTYTIFKSTDVYRNMGEYIEFLPFNVHEIWAKKVFVDNFAIIPKGKGKNNTIQEYQPLDGKGITQDSDQTVHLFIFGMNQMGTALGVQAALLCHFPNFVRNNQLRTRITFVDYKAVSEGEYFMGRFSTLFDLSRHRTLVVGKDAIDDTTGWIDPMQQGMYSYMGENFMDIEWEFIEGNAASPEIQHYIHACLQPEQNQLCTIAVSFNNPQQSIATALYLPEYIMAADHLLQVLVYQQNSFDMVDNVSDTEQIWKRYTKLFPFGMIEDSYNGDVFDDPAAKWMNAIYKWSQSGDVFPFTTNTMISYSTCKQIDQWWGELNMVDKLSNLDLADSLPMKQRSLDQTDDVQTIRMMSWSEHNRWLTERLMMGFRPLYADEYKTFINSDEAKRKSLRNSWKETKRIHVCICSNLELDILDPSSHEKDERMVINIATVRQQAQQLRVRHIQQTAELYPLEKELLDRLVPVTNFGFWIMDTPITQGLWQAVMGTRGMQKPLVEDDNLPVVNVSWYDVQTFIRVLNKTTGLDFHLPSSQQWEYAYKYTSQSARVVNKDTYGALQSIARTEPEGVVYDMMGNVWEWTSEMYDRTCYKLCGGSYKFSAHYNTLKDQEYQSYRMPSFSSDDIGFRLILPVHFVKQHQQISLSSDYMRQEQRFVAIEAGEFEMGAMEGDQYAKEDEKPRHKVRISKFYMSDVPVTQWQWKAIMGENNNPSHFRGDLLPVENVSWKDAEAFLDKMNASPESVKMVVEQLGMEYRSDYVFRLPTEAEWEYAARGGHKQEGLLYSGSDDADEVAWHHGLTASTHEVRTKKPNVLGLYDMSGNVWEWCNDWYLKTMYDMCREQDPVANANGSARVYRGGSWRCEAEDCRATRTTYWNPSLRASDIGFRIVYARQITDYENLPTNHAQ